MLASLAAFLGLVDERAAESGAPEVSQRPPRPPITPVETQVKKMKGVIGEVTRDIRRDKRKMEREENGDIRRIKEAAERGNKGEASRIANSMVQRRRNMIRMDMSCTRLEGLAQKMQTLQTNAAVAVYFKKSAEIVNVLNSFMTSERIGALSQQMETDMDALNTTQELLDDTLAAMDEADADAFDEEDADMLSAKTIVEQIFTEAGLSAHDMLPGVPDSTVPEGLPTASGAGERNMGRVPVAEATDTLDDDLSARFSRLKRGKNE